MESALTARNELTGACLAVLVLLAGCGKAPHSAAADSPPPAPSPTIMADAVPPLALVPDFEAEDVPTFGGIPLVPMGENANNAASASGPVREPFRAAPTTFETNAHAVRIIKEEETLQLKAYELGGLWLIGYGHLMLEGEPDPITPPHAENLLVKDLDWCEDAVGRYVTAHVSHNEFSALSAFCYNVGSAKLRGSSIVKRLNAGDRAGAANAFLLWNRMNGKVMKALANRRARERALFLAPQ